MDTLIKKFKLNSKNGSLILKIGKPVSENIFNTCLSKQVFYNYLEKLQTKFPSIKPKKFSHIIYSYNTYQTIIDVNTFNKKTYAITKEETIQTKDYKAKLSYQNLENPFNIQIPYKCSSIIKKDWISFYIYGKTFINFLHCRELTEDGKETDKVYHRIQISLLDNIDMPSVTDIMSIFIDL